MICNTVLDALGNTPLIRLNRLTGPEDAEVLSSSRASMSAAPSRPAPRSR